MADDGWAELLVALKVGGTYWGAQPALPDKYVLLRASEAVTAEALQDNDLVLWTDVPTASSDRATVAVSGDCDPWHMLANATMLVASPDDDLCLIAWLLGVPLHSFDPTTSSLLPLDGDWSALLQEALAYAFDDPFSGQAMSAREAIDLCGFWRRLIDSNRDIAGGMGIAFWKQDQVAPLLWGGGPPFRFLRNPAEAEGGAIAIWRSKVEAERLMVLEGMHGRVLEVEDGFIRSAGLGADCVPPLSITVDRLGPHFDPRQPSELEQLLQEGTFDQEMLLRAARLRKAIVEAGIGKYELASGVALERRDGTRRHILVPGQVEDDRAVQTGGCGLVSNLELLARVRADAPDAYILYKPHPDVVAGHRRGAIPDSRCLEAADEIVGNEAISSLIEMVDEVHVNTSLAGFEALLRNKPVTTHGVPFYAGWGLTRDLGPVPSRRTARRGLDELVAGALLVYPRYLDPVTGLPCPAEVLVERLSRGANKRSDLLVLMRRAQGRFMRRLRNVVQ